MTGTATNGITSNTVKNIILDAGAVYLNYGVQGKERLIGATEGGCKFKLKREIKEITVDGAKGKVKGLRRITREEANLTVNLKEQSKVNFLLALPGTVAADSPAEAATHDSITSTGNIVDTDYCDNVALVAKVSGSEQPCIIIIKNGLADGDLEIATKDKDDVTIAVDFSAHFDPADLKKVPYEIRYPKIV